MDSSSDNKTNTHNTKKSSNWFAKHKVATAVLAIIALIIMVSVANGGSKPTTTDSTTTANTTPTSSTTNKPATTSQPAAKVAARQVTGTATTLGAGTFTGGKDVANGLYDVTPGAGQSGNFTSSGTDSYNEILGGGDVTLGDVPMIRVQFLVAIKSKYLV